MLHGNYVATATASVECLLFYFPSSHHIQQEKKKEIKSHVCVPSTSLYEHHPHTHTHKRTYILYTYIHTLILYIYIYICVEISTFLVVDGG